MKQDDNYVDIRQKSRENLIVLLLGSSRLRLSMLHLEKEVFLLWKFHPDIEEFISFIKHYRGPYSRDIKATIESPMYCMGCWEYSPPLRNDRLTGGYVRITLKGEKEYSRLVERLWENANLRHLLSAIKMVRKLYDRLSPEELLLLIYDTYPEYIEKSEVYKDIFEKKRLISLNLFEKGVIDQKRLESLIGKSRINA